VQGWLSTAEREARRFVGSVGTLDSQAESKTERIAKKRFIQASGSRRSNIVNYKAECTKSSKIH
jgi:hypothetical protein